MLYWTCEALRELTIYGMVIFSPWIFGTTQGWSIWAMNIAAYWLCLLSTLSFTIRKLCGYGALQRGSPQMLDAGDTKPWQGRLGATKVALGIITVALPAYCLISALNARATFHREESRFEYYACIPWLPHSYDSNSTWLAFWTCLGFACSFWSMHDWLLGKSGGEKRSQDFPTRLRRLLWVLSLNGGLLASECIIQRLTGSPKLLFLIKPHIHQTAITQFGPYAYRANAAQYLNLLWPLCLGFWWALTSRDRPRDRQTNMLLLCSALMSAAAIISASRGGALISLSMLVVCTLVLLSSRRVAPPVPTAGAGRALALMHLVVLVFVLVWAFGWQDLKGEMPTLGASLHARAQIYETTWRMITDFGVFGTGPGTYETVSELYRPAKVGFWPAQAHNDWLETPLTFGLPGSVGLLVGLGLVLLRWFIPGGLPATPVFTQLSWLGLFGCLIHAVFDFPFQVHSIAFLFVVECGILFTVSRRPWAVKEH